MVRAALLMTLLVFGCSKKSETKQEPAPTPAPKAEETKTPEAKPPAPTQTPAPVSDVKIDCASIVTPADVAKACSGANVEVAVSEHEGKNPAREDGRDESRRRHRRSRMVARSRDRRHEDDGIGGRRAQGANDLARGIDEGSAQQESALRPRAAHRAGAHHHAALAELTSATNASRD
jgi:hypothetical protein